MSTNRPGAHWIRAALQVNPYGYKGRNAPTKFFDTEDGYNAALLDECELLGISLIAITDHWSVDNAAGLMSAAKARGIVALPGFEANSSEGIHVLVIFDADTAFSTINASIGRCDGTPNGVVGSTGASYATILQKMTEDGALVIPAHVNVTPAGLLTTRSGQPLAAMIQASDLHVIAVTPTAPTARDQDAVVAGTGIFERAHPLAVIHADDVMGPRQLRSAGASSWFKVSSACLRSLKLAVRTPETRISLSDPLSVPRAAITGVSWVGGYLGGVDLPISDDLTALIGGRGAGKSTVIESVRYALALEPITPQVKTDHESIVAEVLHRGTIIRLEVQAVTPVPQRFTIEREVPHPPVVIDPDGKRTNLSPEDVLGPVEIFGQHELAELAGSADRVAELVLRFQGDAGDDSELRATERRLRTNREDLARSEESLALLEADLARVPSLQEQVAHYEDTDVPTKLAGQQRLTRDEATFTDAAKRVTSLSDAFDNFIGSEAARDLTSIVNDVAASPQRDRLQRALDAIAALATQVSEISKTLKSAIETASADINAARHDWATATAEESTAYGEILRDLNDRGLGPGKFVDIKTELDALQAMEPRVMSQREAVAKLLTSRGELLAELRSHETRRTERLHAAIAAANLATGGVVIARPAAAQDRSHIMAVIKSHTSGQRTQITAAVNTPDFTPRALAAAIRGGADALTKLDIRGAQAQTLLVGGETLARELDELRVDLAVEVLLQVNGAGLRSMEQLSKGQRATALLLLLLAASRAPLIIDQPEDDLDNNFVYRGVVKTLRELKGRRQVITSTHNANVPVLGDAELIIALESDGAHGKPSPDGIGSLDDAQIRALAENILEGGPAAFNARQHLYGF